MHLNLAGSFPVGQLFGIPVRLHVFFIVLLVAQVLGSLHYGGPVALLWFILLGPVLLFTILVHELGHCLAARSVGGEVDGILLWPLGGLAFIGHTAGPKADMWVAFAGPLTHVPMVMFWVLMQLAAFYAATGTATASLVIPWPEGKFLGVAVCVGATIINISLFAFNLLVPAYPLDGGRILVDSLLTAGVEENLTAKITIGVATPIGIGIIVWGCVQFQMVTILVGAWILYSTYQLFAALRRGEIKQHPMFAFAGEDSAASAYYKFDASSTRGQV